MAADDSLFQLNLAQICFISINFLESSKHFELAISDKINCIFFN